MSDSPITVLMTVRNGSDYIEQAIASLLCQTIRDTQIIVVDDASQDRTPEILASFEDSRIEVIRSYAPLGVAQAKNIGIKRAVGSYVAMMDADDVALPARLAVQKEYLDKRPDLAVAGSSAVVVSEGGHPAGIRVLPACHLALRWRLLVGPPFLHPTIMIRRDCLHVFPYRREFEYSQDYDLWSRLLTVEHGANIRQPLLLYRSHSAQHSRGNRGAQLLEHDLIAARVIGQELPDLDLPTATVSRVWRFMTGVALDDKAVDEIGITFLQMAGAFLAKHEGCDGRNEVLQDVAVAVARRFLPQLRNGAARAVVRELIRIDPLAPLRCAPLMASAVRLRVRSSGTVRRTLRTSRSGST